MTYHRLIGRAPDELVEDAMVGYLVELAQIRSTLRCPVRREQERARDIAEDSLDAADRVLEQIHETIRSLIPYPFSSGWPYPRRSYWTTATLSSRARLPDSLCTDEKPLVVLGGATSRINDRFPCDVQGAEPARSGGRLQSCR
jgi:hypothetical protein